VSISAMTTPDSPDPKLPTTTWDAFLSYTSEDKADFALPIATILRQEGMKIWFDEFEIKPGDSITRSIEAGLANSNVGIIIISATSLKKNWTKYEVATLKTLYVNYAKRIVPVWKDVNADTIKKTDPGLLDIHALDTATATLEQIAYSIISVARPDILSRINSKLKWEFIRKTARTEYIDPRDIGGALAVEKSCLGQLCLESCFFMQFSSKCSKTMSKTGSTVSVEICTMKRRFSFGRWSLHFI
jgi:TIR domain